MRPSLKLVSLLVTSTLAWADGLADLRASLQRLHGHTPLKVDVAYAVRQEHTTFLKPRIHERSLRVHVAEDAVGLHVDWNLPLTGAPAQEASMQTPETPAPTPLGEVLKDLDAVTLESLLNQADPLTNLVEHAQFKAEGRETYQGNGVRVLTFACKPKILTQHQGRVTQAESTFKVWINDDGLPLATESWVDYEGKHSRLYGRIHSNAWMKTTYAVLNQRLIVTSRTSEDALYDYGDQLKTRRP